MKWRDMWRWFVYIFGISCIYYFQWKDLKVRSLGQLLFLGSLVRNPPRICILFNGAEGTALGNWDSSMSFLFMSYYLGSSVTVQFLRIHSPFSYCQVPANHSTSIPLPNSGQGEILVFRKQRDVNTSQWNANENTNKNDKIDFYGDNKYQALD